MSDGKLNSQLFGMKDDFDFTIRRETAIAEEFAVEVESPGLLGRGAQYGWAFWLSRD